MTTIQHSAVLGIGAKLSSTWGASVGSVVSGSNKIKVSLAGLKAESRGVAAELNKLEAAGADLGSAGVDALRRSHERLEKQIAREQIRLKNSKAWEQLNVGSRAGAAFGQMGEQLRTVGKYAAIAGVAGAGAIGLFTKNAIEATAKVETMETALTTLEGTPEKAKKAVAWIQKFGAETPYEFQEVGDAFVRLRSYGIDPTNGALKTLGDTASSMGKPLMSAVEAIADAVTGENERLKEFGIRAEKSGNSIKYFYKNAAGKDATKTVKKNSQEMIANTLYAIWNEKYAGGMEKQSKTWTGLMSNMSDAWTMFQIRVMRTGVFDKLKAQLGSTLDQVNAWATDGTLESWASKIGEAYTYAFDEISAGFSTVKENWPEIKEVLIGVYGGLKDIGGAAKDTFVWIRDAVGGTKNLVIGIAALGAAKTLAPLLSLAKVGWDIVAWMVRATALSAGLGGAGAAAGAGAGAGGAAAGAGAAGLLVPVAAGLAGAGAGLFLANMAIKASDAKYNASAEGKAARAASRKEHKAAALADAADIMRARERMNPSADPMTLNPTTGTAKQYSPDDVVPAFNPVVPERPAEMAAQPTAASTTTIQNDNRRIEIKVDANGADADEVARKVESRMRAEALASYE